MTQVSEKVIIDGVELLHTFRGYHDAVEVYAYQADNVTYSLYKTATDRHWHCDWVTSYHKEEIPLAGDTENADAMLHSFVSVLKNRGAV